MRHNIDVGGDATVLVALCETHTSLLLSLSLFLSISLSPSRSLALSLFLSRVLFLSF